MLSMDFGSEVVAIGSWATHKTQDSRQAKVLIEICTKSSIVKYRDMR